MTPLLKAIVENILPPHVNNHHCIQWFSSPGREYITTDTIAETPLSVFRVGRKLWAAAGALEKLTSYVFMTCLKQFVWTFQELPQLLGKASHAVWAQQASTLRWSLIKPPTEKTTIGEALLWEGFSNQRRASMEDSSFDTQYICPSSYELHALLLMNYAYWKLS